MAPKLESRVMPRGVAIMTAGAVGISSTAVATAGEANKIVRKCGRDDQARWRTYDLLREFVSLRCDRRCAAATARRSHPEVLTYRPRPERRSRASREDLVACRHNGILDRTGEVGSWPNIRSCRWSRDFAELSAPGPKDSTCI